MAEIEEVFLMMLSLREIKLLEVAVDYAMAHDGDESRGLDGLGALNKRIIADRIRIEEFNKENR